MITPNFNYQNNLFFGKIEDDGTTSILGEVENFTELELDKEHSKVIKKCKEFLDYHGINTKNISYDYHILYINKLNEMNLKAFESVFKEFLKYVFHDNNLDVKYTNVERFKRHFNIEIEFE